MTIEALLIDPHGDDVALFAAYSAQVYERAHVVVTHPTVPHEETVLALATLGCTCEFWLGDIDNLGSYLYQTHHHQFVYAPACHEVGHAEHNEAGGIAVDVYGGRVVPYCTYAPRGQRQRSEQEIHPESEMIQRKLAALACYRSQIEQDSTRPWFYDLLDMREWVS